MGSLACVMHTTWNLVEKGNGTGNGILEERWLIVTKDSLSDIGPTPVLPSVIKIIWKY